MGATVAAGATTIPAAADTAAGAQPGGRPRGRPVVGRVRGPAIHVMSFNIRYDREGATQPGDADYWPEREPLVTEFLELEQPSLLGVQEAEFHQLTAIGKGLGRHHEMVGYGRGGGAAGEYSAIFYDTRRFTVLWWDQFWLSDTPQVIGSATWGNTVTRIVTWARLRDARTGRDLLFANSHFDHRSENARVRSAEVVRDLAADSGLPVLFTADCNAAAENSEPYDVLVTDGGLQDTWLAGERLTPRAGTFPNYGEPDPNGTRIDWILASPEWDVRYAAINTWTSAAGRWPSDHTPVQAVVRLEA
ncbi:endonuclease/exonuclease/phosphatase family protein [Myceligenerans sp. TRM 65318]|uniref:Endonuclease/exonuclease/phosphatase family protein n=1 Tax=Myceligenerans pegani TaxID=2776917 RepID=A0ABR9N4B0_9MICO|nr:endonuclease/exonuclease/phosphatase family protein [Myceligenerans sp. TRM 65318]MBE3020184.1 endonuclease/exonuclease/phosphatase family protein [Myceligenerans sp. TRM 65318]